MKKTWCWLALALAMPAMAHAAPNVANATQKGSLLVFPDILVDATPWNSLVRIQNDGGADVDIECYWLDGNKNRVDFTIPVTRNQPVWFDARTGRGTYQVNPFPQSAANGFDNPFLPGPAGPYRRGMLVCWAVDATGQHQVKWNHLSGTATNYSDGTFGAYEYNAYAFFVPTGIDLEPVGTGGTLNLNGVEYDSCPLYQIGQFSPAGAGTVGRQVAPTPGVFAVRLAVAGCTLNLNQDWVPVWTKLQFDVWNEDEVKFTGAYECADSWHETYFGFPGAGQVFDAAAQNFDATTLGTYAARYRVQGVKSGQCADVAGDPKLFTEAVGILGVQSIFYAGGPSVGSNLASAGKFTGKIVWDPAGAVFEGGIR